MQFYRILIAFQSFNLLSLSYPVSQQGSPQSTYSRPQEQKDTSYTEQPMEKHPQGQKAVVIPAILVAGAMTLSRTRKLRSDWNNHIDVQYVEGLIEMQRDPEFKKCVDKRYGHADHDQEIRSVFQRIQLLDVFDKCRDESLARLRGESLPEEPEHGGLQHSPRDPNARNDLGDEDLDQHNAGFFPSISLPIGRSIIKNLADVNSRRKVAPFVGSLRRPSAILGPK